MEPWRASNQPTNDVPSNNASHAPRWLLQCCQSSETHHIHNLIRHHCPGVPRLRSTWPPSSSSRICRGPDRTMLLLAEKGGLTKAPEAQEAASLDSGGLATWHQNLAPTTLPPEHYALMTAHPIAQVLPRDRHVVGSRPRVSGLDGTKRLRLGLPTHDFSTRGEPIVLQQNQRTVRLNRLYGIWPPRGGLCDKSRGSNKNSFHALVAARSSLAARALSASTSANRMAALH